MTLKNSFSSLERDFIHEFREKLNTSEDSVDVSNIFAYTVSNILTKVFDSKVKIRDDDVLFDPSSEKFFKFSLNLSQEPIFKETIETSDLENVISRFADTTHKKYIHLQKHNEKTTAKVKKAP